MEQELFGTAHNPLFSLTRRWMSTVMVSLRISLHPVSIQSPLTITPIDQDVSRLATGLVEIDDDTLVTDLFRLHKMIVLTDAAGTVYGLDSRRGRVHYVVPADGSQTVAKASLHQLRSSARGSSVLACMRHYTGEGSLAGGWHHLSRTACLQTAAGLCSSLMR